MNEATESFLEWFKEKTSSPLYFTFIGFVIVWNWKFFYILFWESPTLFNVPKIEYIHSNLELSLWLHLAWFFLLPAISTYITIVWLPKLNALAYEVSLGYYFKRQVTYDSKRLEYERKKTGSLRSEAEEKTIQKGLKYKIKETLTQEEQWDIETKEVFSFDENIRAVKTAITIVYRTGGLFGIAGVSTDSSRTSILPEALSRLDTLGLVSIDNERDWMEFTEKGKYFVKKLQNQKDSQKNPAI